MMRPLYTVLLAGLIAFPVQGLAQPQVDLDYATFAYTDDTSLLEFYFAFAADALTFQSDSLGFLTTLPLHLTLNQSTITQLNDTPAGPVWADTLNIQFAVPDTLLIQPGQHFVHQTRTQVVPGEYELTFTIPAEGTRPAATQSRDVVVPDYQTADQARLSDFTLATTIRRSQDRNDPFFKNGLAIQPNPNLLYGSGLTKLFYYLEAYHLNQALADSSYTAYLFVSDANQSQPWPGLQKRALRRARHPDVLVGSFDLSGLPSGSYVIHALMLNADNEAVVEQNRKFFVFNPDVQAVRTTSDIDTEYEASVYAAMTEEEVEEGLNHIKVIATDQERKTAKDLESMDDKRQFLMSFWRKRDTSPETPGNEYKQEYYSRHQYAKERYGNNFNEGWSTDRGQIILKYGIPSSVEPRHYERNAAPHEIWEYNNIPGEGRSTFIFADVSGFGEYELLHTNVTGERKTPDWRTVLRNRRR